MNFGGLNNSMLLDWTIFFIFRPDLMESLETFFNAKKEYSHLSGNTYSHEI